MLVVVCGQEGSGKSVALEIIDKIGYPVFNTDHWINEIYQVGEVGYNLIKDRIVTDLTNSKGVDPVKLKDWLNKGYDPETQLNQNLLKLNNLLIPLIKKRLVALRKQYSISNIVFVELGAYLDYESLFHDVADAVICIKGRKTINNPIQLAKDPDTSPFHNKWYFVDNSGSITEFKNKLTDLVNNVVKFNLKKKFHFK